MYTLILNKEDFKEKAHWIALCDSLDISNTIEEIMLFISGFSYEED